MESLFYLIIYLYNESYLPWRDFRGTFKQMVIQRLQIRVTKSLFKLVPSKLLFLTNNILDCLEEALKYVILLNFDEEPKYDYLIEELKKAYNQAMIDSGEKPSESSFKLPVFDWNVRDILFLS
jgi:hypothetical protein